MLNPAITNNSITQLLCFGQEAEDLIHNGGADQGGIS